MDDTQNAKESKLFIKCIIFYSNGIELKVSASKDTIKSYFLRKRIKYINAHTSHLKKSLFKYILFVNIRLSMA